MEGTAIFYAVLGLALGVVLLTSLIKNTGWNHKAKNAIATVLSVVGAGVIVLVNPGNSLSDGGDFMALATSAYGSSQLIYNFILRGTGVEEKLAEIGSSKPDEPEPVGRLDGE